MPQILKKQSVVTNGAENHVIGDLSMTNTFQFVLCNTLNKLQP